MRKIIDSHVHISGWGEADLASCFDEYKERVHAVNVHAIPLRHSNAANNIILAFYKLARPDTYIHGGIDWINFPVGEMPDGMDAVTQYRELMEIGFDGIKMLEGKPSEHKRIGMDLHHPSITPLYAEMEKDGTHLLMHSNDPDEFWDADLAPDWAVKNGWAYLDGTYASFDEIHRQTVRILEDHPKLSLTLAHFFFCGKEPAILTEMFAKYPNFCVDLTPGGEMYVEFEKNYGYYRDFFHKYSDRLIFGTDRSYHGDKKYADWLFDVVTTFLGTDQPRVGYDNKVLMGLGLPEEKADAILYGNFERRVGKAPKPLDREKLKAYIEKYSFTFTVEDRQNIRALAEKYL